MGLKLLHTTTGTAATGLGEEIQFWAERASDGGSILRASIAGIAGADVNNNGDLVFYSRYDTGSPGIYEVMRLDGANRSLKVTGFVDMPEQAAPAAPGANTGRLFVRDNGGGKSQLCMLFPTGVVQAIATEP